MAPSSRALFLVNAIEGLLVLCDEEEGCFPSIYLMPFLFVEQGTLFQESVHRDGTYDASRYLRLSRVHIFLFTAHLYTIFEMASSYTYDDVLSMFDGKLSLNAKIYLRQFYSDTNETV